MVSVTPFSDCFEALTGYSPLKWQGRLFTRMAAGQIPSACDLPTGLGKTSIIPIWLIAVASQRDDLLSPRRLVYIVNRRTVVDQATQMASRIRERLRNPEADEWVQYKNILISIKESLRSLSTVAPDDEPFGLSTLRGELADNQEWKVDPARPAVIIGTIDMIGSKLLFSGYGDGRYHRVHHAGLIGQDVLIVHDEAHLTPAFSNLLRTVETEQKRHGDPKPARVIELSATRRDCGGESGVLQLEPEDEHDEVVLDRLDAEKVLRVCDADSGAMAAKLVELATAHESEPSRVLIYVLSPERGQEVREELSAKLAKRGEGRIALLTGTMRGHERDQLVRKPPAMAAGAIIRLFLDGTKPERTVYIVSTSAGEVGIDLDADHMVCDLTTLDAFVQRLGRVNRRGGEGRLARVDVVAEVKREEDRARESKLGRAVDATRLILQRWTEEAGGDLSVSPRGLRGLLAKLSETDRAAAFSPKPPAPPLTDILLDAFSLTSVNELPGRPEVAAYLHGLSHDPPETYVAWRKEVALLHEAKVEEETLGQWFHACRIQARERLQDRTDRIKKALSSLVKAHTKRDENRHFPLIVLNERGEAQWQPLSAIDDNLNLAYKTLVLPVEAGGLDEHGLLDGKALEPVERIDVAETLAEGRLRQRWLHTMSGGGEQWKRLLTGETAQSRPQGSTEEERISLKSAEEDVEGEEETTCLVLLAAPTEVARENPEIASFCQTLEKHTELIEEYAGRIADRLCLESAIKDAVLGAAKWHDRGKDRGIWQRYARNQNGSAPLAKSERYRHPRELGGYRHEFGSLLEARGNDELRAHPERELILHLIAAHHGHARPHFENRAFDNEHSIRDNEDAAAEVMRRFGQLQHRFGRWGLAWLECLLRCADIAASQPPTTSCKKARLQGT